jgi:hypothetical protein
LQRRHRGLAHLAGQAVLEAAGIRTKDPIGFREQNLAVSAGLSFYDHPLDKNDKKAKFKFDGASAPLDLSLHLHLIQDLETSIAIHLIGCNLGGEDGLSLSPWK